MPEYDPPRSMGEILESQGKVTKVRLTDGRIVTAYFARRIGCIFESVIGWKVKVQFRKNPIRPALIIRRLK